MDHMYGDYFLDYASYVILERAVPHIHDGLKPVQRRILHAMREIEDGRYNKVANIVGDTMKYHPHGDASIGDALVALGQKELLIDTQGNWGNLITGDRAAAPRYIEARLTKFALQVAFSPKVTQWQSSYDGRRKEPITLPIKFPLLLAQGAEGIAVGLSCKILPHNFCELLEACIAALRGEPFELFPDFPQGGLADCGDYQEGKRGGRVRVRARIEPTGRKNVLRIVELPFGVTTTSLLESIAAANEKGKIKILRIDDVTADRVDIEVHVAPGTELEQAEQGLYAFTDCEVSIAPNCCVIEDNRPHFLGVHELVRRSAEHSKDILRRELEVRLGELKEKHLFGSLEKIFIEKRIYRDIEECETWAAVVAAVWDGLRPHLVNFYREIVEDDILKLLEIRIKRISKYDTFQADEILRGLEGEIEEVEKNLRNLTRFAVAWFKGLLKDYGAGRGRRTELASFERVEAAKVAAATETLFLDRKEGFAGTGLKRGQGEEIGKCSQLDDLLIVRADGVLMVSRVDAKVYVGKNPLYVGVFDREAAQVFAMIYRDGTEGKTFAKRFRVGGVTRDREYPLTQGTAGSRVFWFGSYEDEASSDAVSVVVHLKQAPRLRVLEVPVAWSEIGVKGRASKGNQVTPNKVDRVVGVR